MSPVRHLSVLLMMLAAAFAGAASFAPGAQAQSRYALVIGVDRYERAPSLRNPSNDARDLAARLSALDYTLIGGGAQINTTRDQMLDHLDTLATRARAGDTVLVFFAGHGSFMGEGDSAETYLIPTDDARLTFREDLADRAVGLSAIMRRIQASGAAGVVIIDACRDLPLPSRVGGRSMSRGLAPPRSQAASGLFIAYAADVGQIASDGTGRNSPFTQALLQALQNPARRVEDVFFDVRRAVLDLSQGRQTPLVQSYLDAPLFFTGAGSISVASADIAPVVDPCARALAEWPLIERAADRAVVQAYRTRLPEACATLRDLADARLRALEPSTAAATAPHPAPAPSVSASAGGETAGGAAAGSAVGDVAPRPARRVGEVFRDWFTDGPGQGPEMVVLPSGSFTMGSPESEPGRSHNNSEGPQRTVGIGHRLAVGRYEVTFAEWDACVADGGCNGYHPNDWGWGRGNRPAMRVSWNDAQAFVTWLNRKTGLTGRADRYRLPSEAEWEYAARAGTTTAYSFGDDASQLGAHAWFRDNANGRTQPVGGKRANAFGLHDMHGNVWEWVEDCWNGSHAGAPTDGSARTTGDCSSRVFRGGSWGSSPQALRSARRGTNSLGYRTYSIGFRLARTLPD